MSNAKKYEVFSSYYDCVLHPDHFLYVGDYMVEMIKAYFEKNKISECAIVVRGTSGLLLGPYIAAKLGQGLCIVRKSGEGSHSTNEIEGMQNVKRYIVVDDFVSSGETVRQIHVAMSTLHYPKPVIKAVVGYVGRYSSELKRKYKSVTLTGGKTVPVYQRKAVSGVDEDY